MGEDSWENLADHFADEAYASVKGLVRTTVLHQQLLEHLPAPPAAVLEVGGGAGHQSFPLARAGYNVTLLDPSAALLGKAQQRLRQLPDDARHRVTLLQADGENADEALDGRRFAAVLCHGALGYLEDPEPLIDQLCRCVDHGGVVSIMAATPTRWRCARLPNDGGTTPWPRSMPAARSGCWEFRPTPTLSRNSATSSETAGSSRRDPYRQLSRIFHLVGRKGPN